MTRDQLQFLPDPRTRAAFENMFLDVTQTLPDSSQDNSQAAADALALAQSAKADAANAQGTADAAQDDVDLVQGQAFVTLGPSPDLPGSRELVALAPLMLTVGAQAELSLIPVSAFLPVDVSDTTGAFVDATGLLLGLDANAVYDLSALVIFRSAATTTGLAVTLTLPAGATISGGFQHNDTATTVQGSYNATPGAVAGNTSAAPAAASNIPLTGRWLVTTSATAGNAQMQFRTGVATSAVTLKAGSMLRADRLL